MIRYAVSSVAPPVYQCNDMKDFHDWNKKKIKINENITYNHPKEKEIWWCSIGVNIGSEVYGKGSGYTRPVLVINAEGSECFIGIPLTSNVKKKIFLYYKN